MVNSSVFRRISSSTSMGVDVVPVFSGISSFKSTEPAGLPDFGALYIAHLRLMAAVLPHLIHRTVKGELNGDEDDRNRNRGARRQKAAWSIFSPRTTKIQSRLSWRHQIYKKFCW